MEHDIYTLHEFMLFTKSQLYPLAAVFLVVLLGFWIYLTGGEKQAPQTVRFQHKHKDGERHLR